MADDAIKKYRHVDFSGGQNDNLNSTMIKDNEAVIFKNATLDFNGALYPAKSCPAMYGAPVNASGISGLGIYAKSNGVTYVLLAIGHYLFAHDITNPDSILAIDMTYSESDVWCFVTFKDHVYICNGKDVLKKWDGSTVTQVSTKVFKWMEIHNNVLWGVAAGSKIYYSDISGDVWDDLAEQEFNPSDGDDVVRIQRNGSNLMVFKTKSKAIITGDRETNYSVVGLEGDGIGGGMAADIVGSITYYADGEGAKLYDLMSDYIISTQRDKYWKVHCNTAKLGKACVKKINNYIVYALPMDSGKAYNTEVWVYDTSHKSWITIEGFNISAFAVARINGADQLLAADATKGQIYYFFKSQDETMTYTWRSKDWHFNFPERTKLFKNLFIEMEALLEDSTLDVTLYTDGQATLLNEPLSFDVPKGFVEGEHRQIRIIPALYGAVMGNTLGVQLHGKVGIKSVSIEFALRSTIPPGSVV